MEYMDNRNNQGARQVWGEFHILKFPAFREGSLTLGFSIIFKKVKIVCKGNKYMQLVRHRDAITRATPLQYIVGIHETTQVIDMMPELKPLLDG